MDNAATELFTALDTGQVTPAASYDDVVAYWDYVNMKANARFTVVWGYGFQEAFEKRNEPGCPTAKTKCGGGLNNLKHKALVLGDQYYTAYLDYARIAEKGGDVYQLSLKVKEGFDLRSKLPDNRQTLYWVGESTAELLKYL